MPRKYYILLLIIYCLLFPFNIKGQQLERGSTAFFDSIDNHINYLQKQIERFKQKRDVNYLNIQRELDHTIFVKAFEEYVVDEDLEKAKELVSNRIEKSEFRRDLASLKFYREYEDKTYALIKQQRIYYQQLFQKEKIFKKELEKYTSQNSREAFQKAQRIIYLALKYAQENNLTATIEYLNNYDAFVKALMFDLESSYDLADLTNNEKSFEKVFQPLISSDSLQIIKQAEELISHCKNFGKLTNSSLDGEFFRNKEMLVTAAISEIFDREGREKELSRFTDQSVVAQYDSLNPCGVFKWHEQIIVIDEFMPTSSMESVKKGEAIIHSDRMLATYLQKNKLCQSIKDLKFGYAFIIPYKSDAKNSAFFYNRANGKWQFIACYTIVNDVNFTREAGKLMPPLFFEDEMNVAVNNLP